MTVYMDAIVPRRPHPNRQRRFGGQNPAFDTSPAPSDESLVLLLESSNATSFLLERARGGPWSE